MWQRRDTTGDWAGSTDSQKVQRDGLQGAEKSPEIRENENYYMYVHVPVKRVLGFQQILQGIFSTLQKVRNNFKGEPWQGHSEDPNDKKKRACEDLGRVGEGTRESKAKLM